MVFRISIGIGFSNKYEARYMGSAILTNSEGWRVKIPKSNHRFAPLISFAKRIVIKTNSKEVTKKIKDNILYISGSGWLNMNIKNIPNPTNIACFMTMLILPCDALYKKNSPITDNKVMEINRYWSKKIVNLLNDACFILW